MFILASFEEVKKFKSFREIFTIFLWPQRGKHIVIYVRPSEPTFGIIALYFA